MAVVVDDAAAVIVAVAAAPRVVGFALGEQIPCSFFVETSPSFLSEEIEKNVGYKQANKHN